MKYAYYPGCALHATAIEFDKSTREVCVALDIELQEMEDWNCCGAAAAHMTNELLADSLPAKNLAIASKMGLDITSPCAICINRLKTANKEINESQEIKEKVSQVIEESYDGQVKARLLLDILATDIGIDKIKENVIKELKNLKVVSYYGCLVTRPKDVAQFDNVEDPQSMDNLMAATGAKAIDWPFKTVCCGADYGTPRTDIVLKMANDILSMAKDLGADTIAVTCPLCQMNLELRQKDVEKEYGEIYNMPILYFTEVLGLSFGIEPKALGLDKHIVDAMGLLMRKGLI
ncbi:MAG: CoB--CoM heterodisulfide reductase iron-sulfur subunit B family protein [bacterium]|nr:CoB--CoM heterodisulfide reductase iron-sulfur subunit B family protein [bacterium]